MAQAPLRRCNKPGCSRLVRTSRCDEHSYKSRSTTKHQELYRGNWPKVSKHYRQEHPLCVACLFNGRIKATECVDHILPHQGNLTRFDDQENLCSLCWSCHTRKTQAERKLNFDYEPQHTVICGLPGAGKTTIAKELGIEFWDADLHSTNVSDAATVQRERNQWITQQKTHSAVIVSHPIAAMEFAAKCRGKVMHVTCDESERGRRIRDRGVSNL